MKKLAFTITLLALISSPVLAQSSDNWIAVQYYNAGQKYFQSSQYTKAAEEFRKALRVNPYGLPERAGVINSYLSRAAYYYNSTKEYEKALNDLRAALFYIKYYKFQ